MAEAKQEASIKAFKAFDSKMACREFQFVVGETYTHGGPIIRCQSGFHGCENPFDVFRYYPLVGSRFAAVEQGEPFDRDTSDSKIASATITIVAELTLPAFIKTSVSWLVDHLRKAATTGERAHAATTGNDAHAATTGNDAHAATTGNDAHAATTGYAAHAATTGYAARAATTGNDAIAASFGVRGVARAGAAGWVVLAAYDDNNKVVAIRSSRVGENGTKPDTDYRLTTAGEFEEVAT